MMKFSQLFYQYLTERGLDRFSLKELSAFETYLMELPDSPFKARYEEERAKRAAMEEILKDENLNRGEKREKMADLILDDPENIDYRIGDFLLTSDFIRAEEFYSRKVKEMLEGEFAGLDGFFGSFVFSRRILDLGHLLFLNLIEKKDFRSVEAFGKALVILDAYDRHRIVGHLAFLYLSSGRTDDLMQLYLKIPILSEEVHLAVFLSYLSEGNRAYAFQMNEILQKENPYLVWLLLSPDASTNLSESDGLLDEAKKIIEKLNLWFPENERSRRIRNAGEVEEFLFANLNRFEYDLIRMIGQNRGIPRGKLYNRAIGPLFEKTRNALKATEKFDECIDKLEKEFYIKSGKEEIFLTPLGEMVFGFDDAKKANPAYS